MRVAAIDLGVTGAMALWDHSPTGEFSHPVDLHDLDTTNQGQVASRLKAYRPEVVVVEKVHAMPLGSKATFAMGQSKGTVLGACAVLRMQTFELPPKDWQAWHDLAGLSAAVRKDAHRARASTMQPQWSVLLERKKDHNRADAVLLGTYAMGCGVDMMALV